jgi:hypothetical protein
MSFLGRDPLEAEKQRQGMGANYVQSVPAAQSQPGLGSMLMDTAKSKGMGMVMEGPLQAASTSLLGTAPVAATTTAAGVAVPAIKGTGILNAIAGSGAIGASAAPMLAAMGPFALAALPFLLKDGTSSVPNIDYGIDPLSQRNSYKDGTRSVRKYNEGSMGVTPTTNMNYAGGTDSVPAMLTPGEAVIPAAAAQNPANQPMINSMVEEGRAANNMAQKGPLFVDEMDPRAIRNLRKDDRKSVRDLEKTERRGLRDFEKQQREVERQQRDAMLEARLLQRQQARVPKQELQQLARNERQQRGMNTRITGDNYLLDNFPTAQSFVEAYVSKNPRAAEHAGTLEQGYNMAQKRNDGAEQRYESKFGTPYQAYERSGSGLSGGPMGDSSLGRFATPYMDALKNARSTGDYSYNLNQVRGYSDGTQNVDANETSVMLAGPLSGKAKREQMKLLQDMSFKKKAFEAEEQMKQQAFDQKMSQSKMKYMLAMRQSQE